MPFSVKLQHECRSRWVINWLAISNLHNASIIAMSADRFAPSASPAPNALPTRVPALIAIPSAAAYIKYEKLTNTVCTAVAVSPKAEPMTPKISYDHHSRHTCEIAAHKR